MVNYITVCLFQHMNKVTQVFLSVLRTSLFGIKTFIFQVLLKELTDMRSFLERRNNSEYPTARTSAVRLKLIKMIFLSNYFFKVIIPKCHTQVNSKKNLAGY